MEEKEVIDNFAAEVKKIEEEAEKILEDAKKEAVEIIANAKSRSITLLTEKQKKLDNEKDETLKQEKAKIIKEKDKIIAKGRLELEEFEKKANKNINKAVELVLKKLDEKIGEL